MIDSLEGASREELEQMLDNAWDAYDGIAWELESLYKKIYELEAEQEMMEQHRWDIERALTGLGT